MVAAVECGMQNGVLCCQKRNDTCSWPPQGGVGHRAPAGVSSCNAVKRQRVTRTALDAFRPEAARGAETKPLCGTGEAWGCGDEGARGGANIIPAT